MLLQADHIDKSSGIGRQTFDLHVQTVGNSESDTLFDSVQPGYAFEIVKIQHFAEAVTATASYKVKIGTTDQVAATTPTADTRGDATITGTGKGGVSDVINLHCTTDGTGAFTGLKVKVTVVPKDTRSL